jgi:hypothetical protein
MKEVYIHLDSGRLVKEFARVLNNLKGAFEIESDSTILDARSILGVYTLNLSQPLLLRFENDSEANIKKLNKYFIK